MSKGIDYGHGITNVNLMTGIRYGVIQANYVGQSWYDASEGEYPTPYDCDAECICDECNEDIAIPKSANWGDTLDCEEEGCSGSGEIESGDSLECIAHNYTDDGYECTQGQDSSDIFVTKSPYYTYAPFCSPCAPGACYLTSDVDSFEERTEKDGEKAYCFGHDWFYDSELKHAPYTVYSVATNEVIKPTE